MSLQHMAQRALLYRRPSEPQTIEIVFDGSVYPVRLRRHRQARRYTLRIQATTREVILTIPPRGTVKEARAFAQKHGGWIAARLGRLPEARRLPTAWCCRCAACRTASPIAAACAARSGPRPAPTASAAYASPARRRMSTGASATSCAAKPSASCKPRAGAMPTSSGCASSASPCAISRAAGAHARQPACCRFPGGSFWRRRQVLELSRRARSGASRRDEPFAEILAAGATHLPGSRARQGLARRPRRRSAPLRLARVIRSIPFKP